jgi:hypothetical protein
MKRAVTGAAAAATVPDPVLIIRRVVRKVGRPAFTRLVANYEKRGFRGPMAGVAPGGRVVHPLLKMSWIFVAGNP